MHVRHGGNSEVTSQCAVVIGRNVHLVVAIDTPPRGKLKTSRRAAAVDLEMERPNRGRGVCRLVILTINV